MDRVRYPVRRITWMPTRLVVTNHHELEVDDQDDVLDGRRRRGKDTRRNNSINVSERCIIIRGRGRTDPDAPRRYMHSPSVWKGSVSDSFSRIAMSRRTSPSGCPFPSNRKIGGSSRSLFPFEREVRSFHSFWMPLRSKRSRPRMSRVRSTGWGRCPMENILWWGEAVRWRTWKDRRRALRNLA